jgi:hypothetical protein
MSRPVHDLCDIGDLLDAALEQAELLFLASHGLSCRTAMNAMAHGASGLIDQINEVKSALIEFRGEDVAKGDQP